MGQSKEETKTEVGKFSEKLENDQQFTEEERPKELVPIQLNTNSEADELCTHFSSISLSKCPMKTVELASPEESESESESESQSEDELKEGERLKRGPINGIPVSWKNTEHYFTYQDQYNGNKSKRMYDNSEDPYIKYQKPVLKAIELTEPWLNTSIPEMYGDTISISSCEYENTQNTPFSDDSSSSIDLNDIAHLNDIPHLNTETMWDDLMRILEQEKKEENNKDMYSNSPKADLICSSKDSHIRNIKETLKTGFVGVSSINMPENTCLKYQDIKSSKASPPPQCVPQLSDLHYNNFEVTEFQNINSIEPESKSQLTFNCGRMSGLNTRGEISMNGNTQEQVLLNSVKQNSTTDECSIINAPPFMRQQFINDKYNFINFCNQEQIASNGGSQSRPVMNVGIDKHTTIRSGTQMQGLHNYGDQGQILMNGTAGQEQPISASSQRLSRVGAVCQGQTVLMNTHNTAQTVISAGNQGLIIMNAGSPNQAIMNAGSPNQAIMNAGSPNQAIMNVGSPNQAIMNVGSPNQAIMNAGSPNQAIMNAGSPNQTIMNAGSPNRSIMNAGSLNQAIVNAGSPSQPIMNAGSPSRTIMNAGSPSQTIVNSGSPIQTIPNALSPSQTVPNALSPSQTILNQTIMKADSPSQTIMNDDEQEQIMMSATSQTQTINNGCRNWMNSINGQQNLSSTSVPCSLNPNKAPLIYSPVTELVGQGGQVYSSQSHVIINGNTSNRQNSTVVTQAIHSQTTTPATLTSTAVSSTPVLLFNSPPLYIMSPTSNALILVQKSQTTKSSPKPILPKPPASDTKPVSEEHIFPKHFNTLKKGKAIFNTDTNQLKPGASHQIIARRCVASRTDDELLAVDCDGNNYLHAAVCVTDVNMVKALLERIKRIDKISIINDCNLINQTPLYLAVSKNKPAVVCELVRNGANPNILAEVKINETKKKRRSALHCAATQGKDFNLTLKQLFESKKIDPNIKNCDGLTPLLCAIIDHGKIVSKNNKSIMIDNCVNVSLLLKNGANPEVFDGRNGMTPLMYAIESKDINLVEAIVKHVDPGKFQKLLLAKTFIGRTCSMIAEELQSKYEPGVYRKLTSILSPNK